MKNVLIFLFFAMIDAGPAYAVSSVSGSMDLAINEVRTFRIDNRLIRTIHYNRAEVPYFEIEMIKIPRRVLIKKIAINSIVAEIENRPIVMDFSKSAGVDIENVRAEKNSILFEVGFTAAEHTAPYIYSTCRIEITSETFSDPACRILKWGTEQISR